MAASQENKELKLLINILHNIERAPQCEKYKSINIEKLTQRLPKSHIDLLMCCGFYKSNNGDRLLFDGTRLNSLPLLRQLLSSYNTHDISNLLTFGFDLDQINDAFKASCRECDNNISKCQQIRSLSYRDKSYMHAESFDALDAITRTEILNEFHHILMFHDINDDDFDDVVNAFGGACELEHCKKIQRYHAIDGNDRNINDEVRLIQYLLDRIHCYIHHGYDTFRFTKDERTQMEHLADGKAQFERRSTILRG
eukprot:172388_1